MLDHVRLKQAFEKLKSVVQGKSQKLFTWSGIEDESIDIGSLHVSGVGLVNVPLQQNDVVKLFKDFPSNRMTQQGKKCYQVDASNLTLLPGTEVSRQTKKSLHHIIYTTLQRMLDLSLENLCFDVQSKLEKLVICANGDSCRTNFSPLSEPGKFGTLLLQVPILSNQSSGKIVIQDGTRETQVVPGNNTSFSITAIAGHCTKMNKASFFIDSGPSEMMAVLVFHLIWRDCVIFSKDDILSPLFFPELLISACEIKAALSPWETTEADNKDETHFLCLPVSSNSKGEQLDMSDLPAQDLIIVKCLSSIMFLDVHLALIAQTRMVLRDGEGTPLLVTSPVHFKKAIHFPHRIADAIFNSPINETKNLIQGLPEPNALVEGTETFTTTAIVFRPRHANHVLIFKDTSKSKPELIIESIAKRVNDYSEKKLLENPFVRKSLLKELERIVVYLDEQVRSSTGSVAVCPKCFFSRLFDVYFQLRATNMPFRVLNTLLKPQILNQLFDCRCIVRPYGVNPVVALARFICFTKSWETCPNVMKQLTSQLLLKGDYSIVFDLALHLMQNDDWLGARETFSEIFVAMKKNAAKPDEYRKMIDSGLVSVVIRLREDKPNKHVLDTLLSGMKHLDPSQLIELIVHLIKLSEDQILDCTFLMKEIAVTTLLGTRFSNYTPQQFLKVVKLYKSMDGQLTSLFWKSTCSVCIRIFNSNASKTCLFCWIMRESKTEEERHEMAADLNRVKELKKALACSLQKISLYRQHFTTANCVEYVDCILLMEKQAQLSKTLIVNSMSDFFSHLGSDILESLSLAFFNGKYALLSDQKPTIRDIYQSLLEKIGNQPLDALLGMNVKNIVAFSALFGAVDIVALIISKVNSAIAASKMTQVAKIIVVFHTLRSKVNGSSTASSSLFNREIFSYLLYELIRSLRCVANRVSCCIEVFQMLSTAERSFPGSTPTNVAEEWSALAQSLTFLEAVAIVKAIFESQMTSEKESLKTLPVSWKMFGELCSTLLLKSATISSEDNGLTESCLVSLTQCFLWIGEEQVIVYFCRFVNELQSSHERLADVHSAIVRDKRSLVLASSSVASILAFNDLVDSRIEILVQRLNAPARADSFALPSFATIRNPTQQFSSAIDEPAVKYQKIAPVCLLKNMNADWLREMEELQTVKKEIFMKSYVNQSQALTDN